MAGINLVIFHGGRFQTSPESMYVGGTKREEKDLDPDLLSMLEVDGFVHDLGYMSIKSYFYKYPEEGLDNLRLLGSDKDVLAMVSMLGHSRTAEIYVDHGVDEMSTVEELPALLGPEPVPEVNLQPEVHHETETNVEVEVEGDSSADSSDGLSGFEDSDEDDDDLFWNNVDDSVDEEVRDWVDRNIGASEDASQFHWDEEVASEYEDSDELVSVDGSDEEERGRRFPEFNASVDMREHVKLETGMIFPSHVVFRQALKEFAIQSGFDFTYQHNDRWRITAVCKSRCGWRIHASQARGGEVFQIKSLRGQHTCGRHHENTRVNSSWLAMKYLEHIRDQPKWNLEAFQRQVQRDHGVHVSRSQCYRARQKAQEKIEGKLKEQYTYLWDYCAAVREWNPGSTVLMLCHEHCFQRLYVCLDACRRGFLEGCRPIISVDGCHLKGMYGGQLLCAIGRDANDNMFPIAYAAVEAETKDSWIWFIRCLLGDIGSDRGHGWTFISDQQKGLVEAFREEFPGADHRCCVRHLYNNFKKDHKGGILKELMWGAARASTPRLFEYYMREVEKVSTEAREWLGKIETSKWSRHGFNPNVKSDALLSNMSETFNSWILGARDKRIVTMLETIRRMLMKRFQVKRDGMAKYTGPICPKIQVKLEKSKKGALDCICVWGGGNKYEVEHCIEGGKVVDIQERTCTCRRWDLTGVPCSHACAAIFYNRELPESYVHQYFSVDMFMKAYSYMIYPVPGKDEWPRTPYDPVLPPVFRRQPGRPKRKRIREVDEPVNPHSVRRGGIRMKCGNCGKWDHNARTCRSQPDPDRAERMRQHAARQAARRSAQRGKTKKLPVRKGTCPVSESQQSQILNEGPSKSGAAGGSQHSQFPSQGRGTREHGGTSGATGDVGGSQHSQFPSQGHGTREHGGTSGATGDVGGSQHSQLSSQEYSTRGGGRRRGRSGGRGAAGQRGAGGRHP